MTEPDRSTIPADSPQAPTAAEIEAALSDLRAQIATPEARPSPPPTGLDAPRQAGKGGIFALMLTAALLGGAAASLLPGLMGIAPQGEEDARRRIGALEARIGQLAAGQSGEAAAQVFGDLKAHLDGLELRLRALEQASAQPPGRNPDGDLAAVQTALNALAERVVTLENRLNLLAEQAAHSGQPAIAAPETEGEIAALQTAIADLTTRLGALERVAPASDLVASLDGRVSALEAADPGRASRQAALALIVARLGDAASAGRPFATELAALKQVSPAIDTSAFEPYAARGLPAAGQLAEQLTALDGAVRDGADYDRGGDWFDRLWRGLGRLIIVRHDGLAEGMEPEDHLARARYHAGRGDIANAHAEMNQLTGAARGAAAPWIALAGARVALDAALSRLTGSILADLARPAP